MEAAVGVSFRFSEDALGHFFVVHEALLRNFRSLEIPSYYIVSEDAKFSKLESQLLRAPATLKNSPYSWSFADIQKFKKIICNLPNSSFIHIYEGSLSVLALVLYSIIESKRNDLVLLNNFHYPQEFTKFSSQGFLRRMNRAFSKYALRSLSNSRSIYCAESENLRKELELLFEIDVHSYPIFSIHSRSSIRTIRNEDIFVVAHSLFEQELLSEVLSQIDLSWRGAIRIFVRNPTTELKLICQKNNFQLISEDMTIAEYRTVMETCKCLILLYSGDFYLRSGSSGRVLDSVIFRTPLALPKHSHLKDVYERYLDFSVIEFELTSSSILKTLDFVLRSKIEPIRDVTSHIELPDSQWAVNSLYQLQKEARHDSISKFRQIQLSTLVHLFLVARILSSYLDIIRDRYRKIWNLKWLSRN